MDFGPIRYGLTAWMLRRCRRCVHIFSVNILESQICAPGLSEKLEESWKNFPEVTNAPRLSEHPPDRGGRRQNVRWDHRL